MACKNLHSSCSHPFLHLIHSPPQPQCFRYRLVLGSRLLHWPSLHLECSPRSSTAASSLSFSLTQMLSSQEGREMPFMPTCTLAGSHPLHPEWQGLCQCCSLLHLQCIALGVAPKRCWENEWMEFVYPNWFGYLLLIKFLRVLCNGHFYTAATAVGFITVLKFVTYNSSSYCCTWDGPFPFPVPRFW